MHECEWRLTKHQENVRIISTRTYQRVLRKAIDRGLSQQAAEREAYNAAREALDRFVPGWEHGEEGFLGITGFFV